VVARNAIGWDTPALWTQSDDDLDTLKDSSELGANAWSKVSGSTLKVTGGAQVLAFMSANVDASVDNSATGGAGGTMVAGVRAYHL
jgi:hypothetical protein